MLRTLCVLGTLALAAASASPTRAAGESETRAASTPERPIAIPIGIRPVLSGPAQDLVVTYRYERDHASDLRDGSREMTASSVLAQGFYAAVPSSLTEQRHDFDVRWTPGSRFSFALGLPVYDRTLRVRTATSKRSLETSEVGDLRFDAGVRFMRRGTQHLLLSLGFEAPTGRIAVRNAGQILPYGLQPGAGVWTFRSGIAYRGSHEWFGYGGQIDLRVRTQDNRRDYHFGNQYDASVWLSARLLEWLDGSFRLDWSHWEDVRGRDDAVEALDAAQRNPANDPELQGGHRVQLGLGATLRTGEGALWPQLAVEALLPVRERIGGPQLSRDWSLRTGVSWVY